MDESAQSFYKNIYFMFSKVFCEVTFNTQFHCILVKFMYDYKVNRRFEYLMCLAGAL